MHKRSGDQVRGAGLTAMQPASCRCAGRTMQGECCMQGGQAFACTGSAVVEECCCVAARPHTCAHAWPGLLFLAVQAALRCNLGAAFSRQPNHAHHSGAAPRQPLADMCMHGLSPAPTHFPCSLTTTTAHTPPLTHPLPRSIWTSKPSSKMRSCASTKRSGTGGWPPTCATAAASDAPALLAAGASALLRVRGPCCCAGCQSALLPALRCERHCKTKEQLENRGATE